MAFVYRAATSKSWIADGVHENAFRRRPSDIDGISVARTPEAAARYVKAKGMIVIDLDKLPPIYTLVPDPDDPEHLCISGLPIESADNLSDVLNHANVIRSCAEVFPFQA